jgi:serine phosphatase RsbU (regulator of sigma subunit)
MTRSKILIVDDEPFNIDFLEQELEDLGYEIISAANGEEALRKVECESPDLILLDIMMPVMDGFEVLSRLKANPGTREIPVIVISAHSDLSSVVHGIQLGAEDYLSKPFEPVLLHARLSSGLEKKHLRDLQQLYLKSLERELEIGRNIQKGFLPASLPRVEGWEIAFYFKAAREVAGDFYDVFWLVSEQHICLVIADVCDKGVGAALFMTLFRSLLRFTIGMTDVCADRSPAGLLSSAVTLTNNYIAFTHGDTGMFATMFIGLLDPETGTLAYINAGHENPLIVSHEGLWTREHRTGPAVGVIPDAKFAVRQVQLGPGDLLFAFTDGAPDALDEKGVRFGADRLISLLHGYTSAGGLLGEVQSRLDQHIGLADQFDDITLLAVRRLPVAGSARLGAGPQGS